MLLPRQKSTLLLHYSLLPITSKSPRCFSEKWRVKSEKVIPKDKSSGIWLRRWDLNHMTSGLWARRATRLLYSAIYSVPWCRWPGSNRYDALASRDFKSRASACSATPAGNTKRLASFRFALLIIAHTVPFVNPFFKNLFFFLCFSLDILFLFPLALLLEMWYTVNINIPLVSKKQRFVQVLHNSSL